MVIQDIFPIISQVIRI